MSSPPTRKDPTVDTLFGTAVPDPYRWLEDPNSDETRSWVTAQNAYASTFLDGPERDAIRQRLREVADHVRRSPPRVHRGTLWFVQHDGLEDQAVVCRQAPDGPVEVVLDPNTMSEDGTVSLNQWTVSPDGTRVAYAISDGGSDWIVWRVRDVTTGTDLDDEVGQAKFGGGGWLADSSAFVYTHFPQPSEEVSATLGMDVRLHRLGDAPDRDEVVVAPPDDPHDLMFPSMSRDGHTLVVHVRRAATHGNQIWAHRFEGGRAGERQVLVGDFEAEFTFLGTNGDELFFHTTHNAPNWRVVAMRLDARGPDDWRVVVPESEEPLDYAALNGDQLVCVHVRHCVHAVTLRHIDGSDVREIDVAVAGTVGGFSGDDSLGALFFSASSYDHPSETFRLDLETAEMTSHWRTEVPGLDPSGFTVERIVVRSKDGTEVPAFVVHDGSAQEGPRPTLLYGYGGFNQAILPDFRSTVAVWVEMGGAYVVANLRGGAEFGRAWHLAGTRERKQNTFDDMISIGEHLCATGFTSPAHLAVHGRSNGGFMAAAVLVQRPDLFAAAIPTVGVLDLLRYHRWTIGWAWASDYGTSEESEASFRNLLALSPLHNATEGTYPPTLIMTADHDDRVVPAHSYKFAAALQAAQLGEAPILLRVDVRAGHGQGKPMSMALDEVADMWTFLDRFLGVSG
ncbi:MAG: prolyl oligopeptidase family serine peptidase [Myxococcales bacterium]|nr:prolyl oligopeptidase family serine peptidase [Myxococcales bacterium]